MVAFSARKTGYVSNQHCKFCFLALKQTHIQCRVAQQSRSNIRLLVAFLHQRASRVSMSVWRDNRRRYRWSMHRPVHLQPLPTFPPSIHTATIHNTPLVEETSSILVL